MAQFEHTEELVVGLYDRGELGYVNSKDDFIELKSHRMSPNYFNGRNVLSISSKLDMPRVQQRRIARLTVEAYVFGIDQAKNFSNMDHIINLPQAVNPIIGAIALLHGDSLLYLRTPEDGKGYGKHKPIEGQFEEGDIVLGIDNVISDGKTKREVTEPIEGSGLVLPEFVVLVDREEGGEAALNAAGYDLTSVIGMGAATRILLDAGRIKPEQAEWSFAYIEQYQAKV